MIFAVLLAAAYASVRSDCIEYSDAHHLGHESHEGMDPTGIYSATPAPFHVSTELTIRAEIEKEYVCSDHFFVFSSSASFGDWEWSSTPGNVKVVWDCDTFKIYGPNRMISAPSGTEHHAHQLFVSYTPTSVHASTDIDGVDLTLNGTFWSDVWLFIGADDDESRGSQFRNVRVNCGIKGSVVETDCSVSDFGPWTGCSKTCGEGATRNRHRSVLTMPTEGGMPCPELSESEDCALPECTYMDHTHAKAERSRDDIFDHYDENLDAYLNIEDLEHMMNYVHIWAETDTADDMLSYGEIQNHTSNYAQLWENIVNSILKMDRVDPNKISEEDLAVVEQELKDAERNFADWTEQMRFAKLNLGMDPDHDSLNVTVDWLRTHAQHAVNDFTARLGSAFHRLGGRVDKDVHKNEVDRYSQYVALLLSIMKNAEAGVVGTSKAQYEDELLTQSGRVADTLSKVHSYTKPLEGRVGPLLGRDDIAHATPVDIVAPAADIDL